MKLTVPIIVYSGILRLLFGHLPDEPDLVITPNTIRIQFLDAPREGKWVIMPGFSELGSPTSSRDGQWIAFDAYKQGFNNPWRSAGSRRDGRDLTRLAFGATPRFSPDGKHLLFVRERVNDPNRREGIYIINRDGSAERWLCEGRWPDWSPDGNEHRLLDRGRGDGGAMVGATICVAKADGSGRESSPQAIVQVGRRMGQRSHSAAAFLDARPSFGSMTSRRMPRHPSVMVGTGRLDGRQQGGGRQRTDHPR